MPDTPKPLVLLISLLMITWVPNAMATDSDGDGVNDSADAFPNDPCADTDTDGDGCQIQSVVQLLAGLLHTHLLKTQLPIPFNI